MLNLAKTEADKMDRNPGTFSVPMDEEEVCAAQAHERWRSVAVAGESNESAE